MNSFYGRCSFLIVYFLAVSSIFSPIRSLSFYNYLWLLLIFIWIIITVLDMPEFFGSQTFYRYSLCLFYFYIVFFTFLTDNISLGNRFLYFSHIPIFYFEYKKNYIKNRIDLNEKLVLWSLPFILLSCYLTYNLYLINPEALRWVSKAKNMGLVYMKMGAGGYNLTYFLVLFIPLLIQILKQNNLLTILQKTGLLFLIIIFSYTVFISGYFIAVAMLVVGLITIFFPNYLSFKSLSFIFIFF